MEPSRDNTPRRATKTYLTQPAIKYLKFTKCNMSNSLNKKYFKNKMSVGIYLCTLREIVSIFTLLVLIPFDNAKKQVQSLPLGHQLDINMEG